MSTNVNYREVSRKALAGERIKIVDATQAGEPPVYRNGDVVTVVERFGGSAVRIDRKWNSGRANAFVWDDEYVVLEPIESAVPDLAALFTQFLADNAPAVRSYLDSVAPQEPEDVAESAVQEVPLTRGRVVLKARERVAELERFGREDSWNGYWYEIEFVVNRDKRAVTALVYELNGYHNLPYPRKRSKPDAVGVAKCAPGEVFNADIGKAIAAERALGLAVTEAFVNAPQPTEPLVGMVVQAFTYGGKPLAPEKVARIMTDLRGRLWMCDNPASRQRTPWEPEKTGDYIIEDTDVDYAAAAEGGAAA